MFQDIPLDKDYVNTFLFEQQGAKSPSVVQDEFFSGLPHLSVSNATYTRENRNSIVVPFKVGQIFNYNYMRFMNRSLIGEGLSATLEDYFENKWYYAFIDSVEYKNNISCTIHYTIDVMQTWLVNLDYTFNYCFIKRQHTVRDNVGENLQPENLSIGDIISQTKDIISPPDVTTVFGSPAFKWAFVIVLKNSTAVSKILEWMGDAADLPEVSFFYEGILSGIYQGLSFLWFPLTIDGMDNMKASLTALTITTLDGIENLFICPACCCPTTLIRADGETQEDYDARVTAHLTNMMKNSIDEYTNFGNSNIFGYLSSGSEQYEALNNKLRTYPYQYLCVSNNRGDIRTYKYEFFQNPNECSFNIEYSFSMQPSCMLYPVNYKGKSLSASDDYLTFDDKCIIPSFPVCSASYLNLVDWLAKGTMIGLGASSGNLTMLQAGSSSPVTLSESTSKNFSSPIYNSNKQKSITYDYEEDDNGNLEFKSEKERKSMSNGINIPINFNEEVSGVSNGDLLFGNDETKLYTIQAKQITIEYAKKIDMYFSKFGYAINEVAVPNVAARDIFTYIETDGCVLKTNKLPHNAERKICAIIDKGITFWKANNVTIDGTIRTPLELIGNYSRDILEANVPD